MFPEYPPHAGPKTTFKTGQTSDPRFNSSIIAVLDNPLQTIGRDLSIRIDKHKYSATGVDPPQVSGPGGSKLVELNRFDPVFVGILLQDLPSPVGAGIINNDHFGAHRTESSDCAKDAIQRCANQPAFISSRDDDREMTAHQSAPGSG